MDTQTETAELEEGGPSPEELAEARALFGLPKVREQYVAFGEGDHWTLADRKAVVGEGTDKLFGIHGSGYRLVPHESGILLVQAAADAQRDTIGPYETSVALYDEGRRMRATLRFPETEFEIASNGQRDLVHPTIEYLNSYDGCWAERLRFGAFRLICSNGLVVGENIFSERVIHAGHRPEQFFLNLGEAIENYTQQTEVWRKWNRTKANEEEHIEPALVAFNVAQQLAIREELEQFGKRLTLWLFFNVMTALITHRVKSLQRQVHLENHVRHVTAAWPS